ncbi:MAG: D-alanine--D-alanine ligase [Nitrococcus mobilis]|nr:D-alanine--D-alanine ligase [Nitrococcus mobilis]
MPAADSTGSDRAAVGRVAVLAGGWSAEREISLQSGAAVLEALRRRGIEAHQVDPSERPLGALGEFDRAFIALHGRGGEDGVIQGALEIMCLPYTGTGVLGSALGMDKLRTKLVWHALGLPTPAFLRLDSEAALDRVEAELGYPVMVKPNREGSSLGMTRVNGSAALLEAWRKACLYDREVFAERWIDGQEYTVSLLGEQALPVIRIESAGVFYDFDAKYRAAETRLHCPCGLAALPEAALTELAAAAFEAVGGSGWGRIDLMRDPDGAAWLLEVNTVPGLTDHSLVPMAARAAGLDMDELAWRILLSSWRGRGVQ